MGITAEFFGTTDYSKTLSLSYMIIDWHLKFLEDRIGDPGKMANDLNFIERVSYQPT